MADFDKGRDLTGRDMATFLIDIVHRAIVHHVMWFDEVKHQLGRKEAFHILDAVLERGLPIQFKRLSRALDFELDENHLPVFLSSMDRETAQDLLTAFCTNWLANDGIWFQAVENTHGMNDAKRCNDSCWSQFSPFEAASIKRFLKLENQPGLDGLKKALHYRIYSCVNEQTVSEETGNSFVFKMVNCRVQSARRRKNLTPYPCKSAGLVEYAYFAREIDDRIQTECIGCPPDDIEGKGFYCAWKFSL